MPEIQSHCPVCKRYCGPAEHCPYCDATIVLPALYRKLRTGAWIIAILGIILLIAGAHLRPPDVMPIAGISPTMQFAQLVFEGELTEAPRISRNQRSAATNLCDGSGQTLRIVFLEEAVQVLLADAVPLITGSRIRVSGGLRIRAEEEPVLFIRSPEQWQVISEAP